MHPHPVGESGFRYLLSSQLRLDLGNRHPVDDHVGQGSSDSHRGTTNATSRIEYAITRRYAGEFGKELRGSLGRAGRFNHDGSPAVVEPSGLLHRRDEPSYIIRVTPTSFSVCKASWKLIPAIWSREAWSASICSSDSSRPASLTASILVSRFSNLRAKSISC